MHHMSMERQTDCRRQEAQATNGLVASRDQTKALPCQRDGDSQGGELDIQMPNIPKDIWSYIHSLLSMRYAAQAACLSHAFLQSWRCHPNLTFSGTTLGVNKRAYGKDEIGRKFSSKVDHILKNHSGTVKKLVIDMNGLGYYTSIDFNYLNSWLLTAVTPGIEELSLKLPRRLCLWGTYNFPCLLLSNGSGDSIRFLELGGCSLRPTAELPWLKGLIKLHLGGVSISGNELGCLLCNSFALEQLVITYCHEIVCMRIPCMLRQLTHLKVVSCASLQVIDNKAPNISSFFYAGDRGQIQLSLGEALKMEHLCLGFSGALHYARVAIPSCMPNLKIADIWSYSEMANTPMLHSKFFHLKELIISLSSRIFTLAYDYFSLVSFLDACPSLETLVLNVFQKNTEHASIFTDPLDLRKMQGHQHHKLKMVKIRGFTSARSLVELTCHFVESITSLECLTLEVDQSIGRCYEPAHNCSQCSPLPIDVLREAQRGLSAIRTYIEPKVPSTVKLHVVEPCHRCHAVQ